MRLTPVLLLLLLLLLNCGLIPVLRGWLLRGTYGAGAVRRLRALVINLCLGRLVVGVALAPLFVGGLL